jgi:Na+/melibiose symporter-like transporter
VSDTADVAPRLRSSQYLGYAAGEVANNLTFQMVAAVAVAGAVAIMLAYALTEKAFRAVVAELAERRAAQAESAPVAARA